MGRVNVKMNKIPKVMSDLPEKTEAANNKTADSMLSVITANIWRDTGAVLSTAKAQDEGSAVYVRVGVLRGRGFYALFLENGTTKMAARPLVRPTAQAHEPIHTANVRAGVQEACRV